MARLSNGESAERARTRLRAVMAFVASFVIALLSLGAVSPVSAVEAEASWSVTGTIYGESIAGPKLADVQVDLVGWGNCAATTRSAADGTYSFSPADLSLLGCSSPNYAVIARHPSGTLYMQTASKSFELPPGAAVTADVVMLLGEPGWRISGTIYGESVVGPKLADVQVDLVSEEPTCVSATTRSSADGTYTLSPADLGGECPLSKYVTVVARHPDGSPYAQTGRGIYLQPAQGAVTVDVVMLLGGSISGQLLSREAPQRPIPGALVTASGSSLITRFTATSDGDGRFILPALPEGYYDIWAEAAGFDRSPTAVRQVSAGTNKTIYLTLREFITVTGTITDKTGVGLPNITVGGTTTDADGNYSLGPAPAISLRNLSISDPSNDYVETTVAVPAAPDAAGKYIVDATLVQKAKVGGKVTVNSAGRPGVGQVTVELVPADLPESSGSYRTTTDANGYFGIKVPPARYKVRFTAPQLGLVDQWWLRAPSRPGGFVLDLGDGTVRSGVDALMEVPSTVGTVSGTVSLQSYPPRPEGGATVELVRRSDGVPLYSALTDSAGAYTVTGVMSGTYDVRFTPVNQGFLTQWYGGTKTQAGSTPVTVPKSGAITGIDSSLKMKNPFQTAPVPTISGGPILVGHVLYAKAGTWVPTPDALTYQWLRSGTAIAGATSSTYQLQFEDAGARISVAVRGSIGTDTAQTKVSAATSTVLKRLNGPAPAITGTLRVGSTLTATTGEWREGVTFTYSWKRNGVVITGAKAATYVLQEADRGKQLSLTVKVTLPGYEIRTLTTPRTEPVLGVLSSAPVPRLSGTLKAGSTLTATTGIWQPAPVSLKFAWQRNGVTIAGATSKSYVLTSTDVGKQITVSVTGTKTGYSPITRKSAPTTAITK